MKKITPADTPDAYVAALNGWRKELVEKLRALVLSSGKLEEVIKWGHLVYFFNGPVLLIRSEEARVLFGFWRGQRLREIDARLKPGGGNMKWLQLFSLSTAKLPLHRSRDWSKLQSL